MKTLFYQVTLVEKKECFGMHAREQILPGTCILGSGGIHKLGE
jgi:hypothetical protein